MAALPDLLRVVDEPPNTSVSMRCYDNRLNSPWFAMPVWVSVLIGLATPFSGRE